MASFVGASSVALPSTHASFNQVAPRISSVKFVSLSLQRKSFPSLKMRRNFRVSCSAKPETVEKVCEIVRKQLALPADSAVTGESKFSSLGADSLDTVEIVMGLEEAFGISVEEESAQAIASVQDAADMIEKLVGDINEVLPQIYIYYWRSEEVSQIPPSYRCTREIY